MANSCENRLYDTVDCPICTEVYANPKLLPCGHSYCLHCLDSLGKDKLPLEELPCPLCRKLFVIPEGGFKDLPLNFYIETIMDMKGIPTGSKATTALASEDQDEDEECSEASTSLQSRRAGQKKRRSIYRPASCGKKESTRRKSSNRRQIFCTEHRRRSLKLYCNDCDEATCELCFIHCHNGHNYSQLDEVRDKFRDKLQQEISVMVHGVNGCIDQLRSMQELKTRLMESFDEVELQIYEEACKMKEAIDNEANELQQKLRAEKTRKLSEVEITKEAIDHRMVLLQGFVHHCENFKETGTGAELVHYFKDLHAEMQDLPELLVFPDNVSLDLAFVPSNLHRQGPRQCPNFVGTIAAGNDREDEDRQQDELSSVSGWSDVDEPTGLQAGEDDGVEEESRSLTAVVEKLKDKLLLSEEREKFLQQRLREAERRWERARKTSLTATPVHTVRGITSNFNVRGLTLLDNELYVLRVGRRSTDIAVFDAEKFSLHRRISAIKIAIAHDMASCQRKSFLYITDAGHDVIHRVDKEGDFTVWSVNDKPCGLSVNSASNVVVTCFVKQQLKEFTSDGDLLRQVSLHRDIIHPWHALEIPSDGRFIVCHGTGPDSAHRVCLLDESIGLVTSFGEDAGPKPGQLNCPIHLALRSDEFIYVLDGENKRIVLLDPELYYVCELLSAKNKLNNPSRMHWDEQNRRLYLAEDGGSVVIFEIM